MKISKEDLLMLNETRGIETLLSSKTPSLEKSIRFLHYEKELKELQIQLLKLQSWISKRKLKVVLLFEGRDAAGKGGAIRRFVEHLNPRLLRVEALPKPNVDERGQWYFQRYTEKLPNPGEIVFFDRSWYNRAVVEPVNNFCTKSECERFLRQVPEYEEMLNDDGIKVFKFWFSITKKEQKQRFEAIRSNPLKMWKISPVDDKSQELWDEYSKYKERMFEKTHTENNPWVIIMADRKTNARLECIKYVLSKFNYTGKNKELPEINSDVLFEYYEGLKM